MCVFVPMDIGLTKSNHVNIMCYSIYSLSILIVFYCVRLFLIFHCSLRDRVDLEYLTVPENNWIAQGAILAN